jgi:hypothetical protein
MGEVHYDLGPDVGKEVLRVLVIQGDVMAESASYEYTVKDTDLSCVF